MLTTEQRNNKSVGLDTLQDNVALERLLEGQVQAVQVISSALPAIAEGARLMAKTLREGGNLGYAAAGSSALAALCDGLEIPGTFGIANNRIKPMIAGGVESLMDLVGNVEDAGEDGVRDIKERGFGAGDCVLAVSASGSTPYTVAAHDAAKAVGAKTICITNNLDTKLAENADVAIELETPPELLAGSTRLGAATAQKVTMNMLSTMMATHLGHVHDGYMVNVRADNQKLLNRAEHMVMAIADCEKPQARHWLAVSGGSVKHAIVLAVGAADLDEAQKLLDANNDNLRQALNGVTKIS